MLDHLVVGDVVRVVIVDEVEAGDREIGGKGD
jgi:hypothetical protein